MTEVDPDAVATAALGCDDVVAVSGGPFGAGTYLPGRRVAGIRITDDDVEVHIVARFGPTMHELAASVRRAVGPVVAGRPVTVVVEDLDTSTTAASASLAAAPTPPSIVPAPPPS